MFKDDFGTRFQAVQAERAQRAGKPKNKIDYVPPPVNPEDLLIKPTGPPPTEMSLTGTFGESYASGVSGPNTGLGAHSARDEVPKKEEEAGVLSFASITNDGKAKVRLSGMRLGVMRVRLVCVCVFVCMLS